MTLEYSVQKSNQPQPLSEARLEALSAAWVPEILAPAGGREQFFAALNSGADAVFLGLKAFNARARAENFTVEDLRELVPLAQRYGMKVLVTLNVLIKHTELPTLLNTLASLEDLEIDAAIVQDLGVVRIAQKYFPNLRLHASTQMAVHNLAGVKKAAELGLKRVVLARELTALEMKKIRASVPREQVEIEAFCHGSLCYSYSGLCFFSGAQDARSGNRGECAYTCRKPYKILNEPGHGFLFSMKDLSAADDLNVLVEAGIDTLKIEGRKKDAQYVGTVVKVYRQKLDEIFGRATLRTNAPEQAHSLVTLDTLKNDLSMSFSREATSFFLKGRYHENVIDLDNPTHKGVRAGEVLKVVGNKVRFLAEVNLERFDGLRIDKPEHLFHAKPQHGLTVADTEVNLVNRYNNDVLQFSLRDMEVNGNRTPVANAGHVVEIELPNFGDTGTGSPVRPVRVGDVVYKTRSAELKRRIEKLLHAPADTRLKPLRFVDVVVKVTNNAESLAEARRLEIEVSVFKNGRELCREHFSSAQMRPTGASNLATDAHETFGMFGQIGMVARTIEIQGDGHWFVPRSVLKAAKQNLVAKLDAAYSANLAEKERTALESVCGRQNGPGSARTSNAIAVKFAVKIDRLEYLPMLSAYLQNNPDFALSELVFEPKRAFLPELDEETIIAPLQSFAQQHNIVLRLAFPTVIRAWDEPVLKHWFVAFSKAGISQYEVGNIGAFDLLKSWGMVTSNLSTDFTLYSLNSEATQVWVEQGAIMVALSIEDDHHNIKAHLAQFPWQQAQPQIILFKDTPLFIAESCSLTALHNGCPTAKVCGYRTLEIENEQGERFFVAHEACKSIVYGKDAFSITQKRAQLQSWGVSNFRLDFLTRAYNTAQMHGVLDAAHTGTALAGTHTANFDRSLL